MTGQKEVHSPLLLYRSIQARHFVCRGRRARGSVINLKVLRGSGRRGSLAASSGLTIREKGKDVQVIPAAQKCICPRDPCMCFSDLPPANSFLQEQGDKPEVACSKGSISLKLNDLS